MATLCLTVKAAPEQQDSQTYFALQRDESQDIVSELDFRGSFLDLKDLWEVKQPVSAKDFQASASQPSVLPPPNCTNSPDTLNAILPQLSSHLSTVLKRINADLFISSGLKAAIEGIGALCQGMESVTMEIAQAATVALDVLKTALSVLPQTKLRDAVVMVVTHIQDYAKTFVSCQTGGTADSLPLLVNQVHCNGVANMYRNTVKDSIKTCPAIGGSAPENMKRAASGSASVLDLMDKSSVASTNEELLAVRPIFAANLLDQYRQELLTVADSEEMKDYAQTNLGLVINMSNALEACLRVAADPATAGEEYNEESEFLADEEDDWEDEDETEAEGNEEEETVEEQPSQEQNVQPSQEQNVQPSQEQNVQSSQEQQK
ncbi:hypothetical protein BGX31_009131 [Mortierella sp. GBA43]|nr:hypothetical protein BGX31_009131 [Mortierella sp. GBA43]